MKMIKVTDIEKYRNKYSPIKAYSTTSKRVKKVCNVCDGIFSGVPDNKHDVRCQSCVYLNFISSRNRLSPCIDIEGISMVDLEEIDDLVFSCEDFMEDDLSSQIDLVLGELNEREQAVIRMRFGLLSDRSERTLEEISSVLHCNRERVRQIEYSGIKKLKHSKVHADLKRYIDDELYNKPIKDDNEYIIVESLELKKLNNHKIINRFKIVI